MCAVVAAEPFSDGGTQFLQSTSCGALEPISMACQAGNCGISRGWKKTNCILPQDLDVGSKESKVGFGGS